MDAITSTAIPMAMDSNKDINTISKLESPSTLSSSISASSSSSLPTAAQTCAHNDSIACESKSDSRAQPGFPLPPQTAPTNSNTKIDGAILAHRLHGPSSTLPDLANTTSNVSTKSKRFAALRSGLLRTTTGSKSKSRSAYDSGSDSEPELRRQRMQSGEEGELAGVALAYIMQYRKGGGFGRGVTAG